MSSTLTPHQREAVEHRGDSMIVAAAGSGKTRVLVEKVAWALKGERIPINAIALVTFSEKAAEELKERTARRLKIDAESLDQASIGTLHALAASLLRLEGTRIGIDPTFQVMDESLALLEQGRSVREGLLEMIEGGDGEAVGFVDSYGFRRSVSLLQDLIVRSDDPPAHARLLQVLRQRYATRKKELNRLDFDDLEALALKLLADPKAAQSCRGRYRWIFVDEFQDTSPIQWKILTALHDPSVNFLTLVGDPRQSIYRFRGADPALLEQVRSHFEKEARVFHLQENFRSEPAVIDLVNRVTAPLFGESYPPLVATKKPSRGDWEILMVPDVEPIEKRREAEAQEVTRRIGELKAVSPQPIPWGEIALLFRTRRAVPIFERHFKAAGIPYQTSAGESLIEKKEVLSILLLLRTIVRESDEIAAYGLEQSPLASLKDRIPDWRKTSLPSSLFLADLREKLFPLFPDATARTNLVLFFKLLGQLSELGARSLTDLVRDLETLRKERARIPAAEALGSKEAVQILTIHAAKGQEFRVVFLCDLEAPPARSPSLFVPDGDRSLHLKERDREASGLKEVLTKSEAFIAAEKREKDLDDEETKRLFYVGLTRAIERVILPIGNSKKAKGPMARWIQSYAVDR